MDHNTITLILTSFLFASFLKGITGLGFSTICLPLVSFLVDPKIAIPLVILPSLTSNVFVMIQAKNFLIVLKRFWYVYLAAAPGIFFGVFILNNVDSEMSRLCLGSILIAYVLWALNFRNFSLFKKNERQLGGPVGFCTGLVNGFTGSQIMPILPYMFALQIEKEALVQALNVFFTFSSLIMIFLLNHYNLYSRQIIEISIMGIFFVAIGISIGGRIRISLQSESYKRLVLIFLITVGAGLLLK